MSQKAEPECYDIWLCFDGRAGNDNQVRAFYEIIKPLLADKSFTLRNLSLQGFKQGDDQNPMKRMKKSKNHHHIFIAAGQKLASRLTKLKKDLVKENYITETIKFVQILVPNFPLRTDHFDLIISPMHDEVKTKKLKTNYITIMGGLSQLTRQKLDDIAKTNPLKYEHPIRLWLIGGNNKALRLKYNDIAPLFNRNKSQKGTDLITSSRRTPGYIRSLIDQLASDDVIIYSPHDGGDNPYQTWLAHADQVIVTADSVNMMTEAMMTKKEVSFLPLSKRSFSTKSAKKYNDCQQNLLKYGQTPTAFEDEHDRLRQAFLNHIL